VVEERKKADAEIHSVSQVYVCANRYLELLVLLVSQNDKDLDNDKIVTMIYSPFNIPCSLYR